MKKTNNTSGSSFLDKLFPFAYDSNEDIQAEDARIKAEAMAAAAASENIDNSTPSPKEESTDDTNKGSNTTPGGINIGTVNGGIHFHIDNGSNNNTSNRHTDDDDDNVIDVDFVDITDDHQPSQRQQPQPVKTPRLTQTKQQPRLTQAQPQSKPKTQSQAQSQSSQQLKQNLTMQIRTGNAEGVASLDQMIQDCKNSGDKTELVELFQSNKALCFWIKRATQITRWNQLPVLVQELINQQV